MASAVSVSVDYFTVTMTSVGLLFGHARAIQRRAEPVTKDSSMKKLLAIAALLGAPALAQANLVVNGGFEDYTTVNAGAWSIFGSGYGWTTGANGVEIRNAVAGSAVEGVRFAELDTTGNSWISQTIHTNANQALELSFSYAPRADVSAGSNHIQIFWNNQSLGSVTGNGNKGSSWLDLFYDVQADANGVGVLTFAASGVSDSFGGSLDNISLLAVSEPAFSAALSVMAVPEPESSALLLAGLGLLAAVSRRRQRRA